MVDGEQLNFLEKLMKTLKQYGLAKTLGAIAVLALVVWALHSENTIDRIINEALDKRTEITIQEEIDALDQRASVQADIYEVLHDLIDDTGADRAFIFEMHNGTNNTAGLPFMYAEMTYEEVKHGVTPVAEDWQKMTMTLYNFPLLILKNGFWDGDLEKLREIDYKAALKTEANDVKYLYICRLNGVRNNCLGALGITFVKKDGPDEHDVTRSSIMATAQKVSILLDTTVKETNE